METRQMIEVTSHLGEGFKVVAEFGAWKVGMLKYNERFSTFGQIERHFLTDEVFVLVSGDATLYTDKEVVKMQQGLVYNVPAGVWHHIVVSKDAQVIVVENSETSSENSERRYFNEEIK